MLERILDRRRPRRSREVWRKHFETSVEAISEWYGISQEEVLALVAEKMELGYIGDAVFDAVKADLDSRTTRIVDRT